MYINFASTSAASNGRKTPGPGEIRNINGAPDGQPAGDSRKSPQQGSGRVTTEALNEEGGGTTSATSLASTASPGQIRDISGSQNNGQVSNGGSAFKERTRNNGDSLATTEALGEEGGGK